MSNADKKDSRWHIAMTVLLYPAFLGALMYEGFEKLVTLTEKNVTCPCATILLIAAMFILYVFDFIYTNVEKVEYDGSNFLCDLIIVIFLYFSFKVAFLQIEIPCVEKCDSNLKSTLSEYLQTPAIWLLLTKLASVIWELTEREKNKTDELNKSDDLKTDLYAGNIYLLIYLASISNLLSSTFSSLFLVIAVSFDIWWYHQRIGNSTARV